MHWKLKIFDYDGGTYTVRIAIMASILNSIQSLIFGDVEYLNI